MKTMKKIVSYNAKSVHELIICDKIKRIPYYFLYFKPILNHKIITPIEWDDFFLEPGDLETKDNEDLDLNMQNENANTSSYKNHRIIIEREYELEKYDSFSYFFTKLKTNEFFINIIDSYKYLLKARYLLNVNNIVNLYLNDESVLFTNNNQPILYDFSSSFINYTNIQTISPHLFQEYIPHYYFWSLEVHIICFLNSNIKTLSKTDIEDICKQYIIKNKGLRNLPKEYIQNYYQTCVKWLISLCIVNQQREKIIEEMLKHSQTWNYFSLSMMYLPKITTLLEKTKTKNNVFLVSFINLLLKNIDPIPEKRTHERNCLNEFQRLFTQFHNTTFWLEIKNSL